MSNITLDTLRSLDASKTYYLANSTGQIKEAGAWQRSSATSASWQHFHIV